jgi:hypothetical protein
VEATETNPALTPAPPELIAKAEALVSQYEVECFWFRHPDAKARLLEESAGYSKDFDVFHDEVRELDPIAMKMEWIAISDKAEEEITRLADTRIDMPIGVAFVDDRGESGWIGSNPDLRIHYGSLRGRWPTITEIE